MTNHRHYPVTSIHFLEDSKTLSDLTFSFLKNPSPVAECSKGMYRSHKGGQCGKSAFPAVP